MQAKETATATDGDDPGIAEAVDRIATLIDDIDAFEAAALEFVESASPEVAALERLLLRAEAGGGDERQAMISAACEILYNSGPSATETLGRLAGASDDQVALEAIRTLARLAWHDVDRAEVLSMLSTASSDWGPELARHALGFLAPLVSRSHEVLVLVDDLLQRAVDGGDVEAILGGLENLARWYPRALGMYAGALRKMVEPVVAPEGPITEDPDTIRAAMLLIRAKPTDEVARRPLQWWAMHHPDPGVRRAVVEALRDAS